MLGAGGTIIRLHFGVSYLVFKVAMGDSTFAKILNYYVQSHEIPFSMRNHEQLRHFRKDCVITECADSYGSCCEDRKKHYIIMFKFF